MCGFVLAVLLLTLSGCDDVVETRFATLDDAAAARAFDRGWLPPLLPPSSSNIVERNNVDLNVGIGTFTYCPAERSAYIAELSELEAEVQTTGNVDVITLASRHTRWRIVLTNDVGIGHYTVTPLSNSP